MRPTLALALATAIASSQLFAQGNPWTNLGTGKAGSFGIPLLTATPMQPGGTVQFRLASARQNAPVYFAFGVRRADTPLLGGTLVPRLDALLTARTTNVGTFAFAVPIPNSRRLIGAKIYVHCVVADVAATQGAAFSNALSNEFCPTTKSNTEDFRNDTFLDAEQSAGTWGNGRVTFSPIGGDGRHGVFDPKIGRLVAGSNPPTYVWNTNGMRIPRTHTMSGQDELVTDGRFYFSRLTLPKDVVVRFVGSIPARIWVQGRAQIDGELQASGRDLLATGAAIQRDTRPQPGEIGGEPGCAGGPGGQGGDRGDESGIRRPNYRGRDGATVQMTAGHAYESRAIGTGGKGSPQHPITNNPVDIGFGYFGVIAMEMNRGGGGGGFTGPGGRGTVRWDPANDPHRGSRFLAPGITPGGARFDFPLGFPRYTNPFSRQDHFLVGGSGGGGGGSCCGGAIKSVRSEPYFRIGRGGGGAGGAIGFRIGQDMLVGSTGSIRADGGAAALDNAVFTVRGMMTPGGGGSGGSLFFQIQGRTRNGGEISVRGGRAGATIGTSGDQVFRGAEARGGDGSPGMIHFEVNQNPNNYPVGTCVPAPRSVTGLVRGERDDRIGVRSRWYAADLTQRPNFLRYEIDAVIDGTPTTFSDDPLYGRIALGSISPIEFRVQGAQLERDASGQLRVKANTTPTPYLSYVGPFWPGATLNASNAQGYRFSLIENRTLGKTIVVKSVRVYWCN